jgi:hypothetical protein
MGQSKFSPSDQFMPAGRLAERLGEAEAKGDLPASDESTSFSMAQRFAPAIRAVSSHSPAFDGPPGNRSPEASRTQFFVPESSRGARASQALLVVLILVSLVPSVAIAAIFWLGMAGPWSGAHYANKPLEAQKASIASSPAPKTLPPKQDVERPSIGLTALNTVQAVAGKEVPFAIAINSADPLAPRTTVTIDGMPKGATFSDGRPYGETGWTLRPDEISGDLKLRLPKSGQTDLHIALLAADGDMIASAFTHINVATDPNSALVLRSEESDRINDLMVHGHKMVEVGYLAGARAYFKRAAEAGSAAAALALGDTYDRVFIDSIGAHGIKADLAQARTWYERARELGSEEAKAKLERLKKADDAQLTSVESAPSNGEPHGSPHTKVRASVDGAQKAGETGTQK